ncbi:hypothetical protein COCSUDRAFT_43452 [Coccomyxa subellipsoidea C-169]|uniref:Telomeric single stranded DNA binding POT1/Cdc13 domain-containing protein n=1 Tax=Coccomyxa subellipsoidea (strain C-169) TaxID=574566 RepID=I0YRT3_COCSC|nr:hypothetical protein COCSUDRAFT_43452 [Coccomyxa subellipsoidea C-169]EIE21102.1 hypothetical protein COCSUDRAFT_43452 [Coccomyxa subellipsoidea C-169]|eukprot:XP_005645646.1 hypothetical protein COCSUDRAFT_43452 [Coccomyxa subellipsoidea C-169]
MAEDQEQTHQEQQQQRGPPQYEYKVLTDILEGTLPMECNLYAVLIECSVPRPTRRVDWMCNARLVDPSTLGHPYLQEGVEVLIFGPPQLLPNPDCVGDIIRIHRLTVQEYKERPQLVATIGPKKRCQICVFRGGEVEGEPIMPYRASTQGFTMGDREENLVKLLRNAMSLINNPSGNAAPSKYLRRINELDPRDMFTEAADGSLARNTFFDICCQVLHVQGEGNRRIMVDTRHDFAEDQNVTLDEDTELLHYNTVYLPLQGCEDAPRLGTAMPVRMYGLEGLPQEVPLPQPGAWVKLRNVAACIINGQLQGLFRKSSKWCPWVPSPDALQILDRREAEGRIQEWAPDRRELVASSSHPNVPFETLRQVHQAGGQGDWAYTFHLILQDATGELDALIFSDNGTVLFGGIHAEDLSTNEARTEHIKSALMGLFRWASIMSGIY